MNGMDGKIALILIEGATPRTKVSKGTPNIEGKVSLFSVTINGRRWTHLNLEQLLPMILAYYDPDRDFSKPLETTFRYRYGKKDVDPLKPEEEWKSIHEESIKNLKSLFPEPSWFQDQVIFQQDGAPGHGYNSRNGGAETDSMKTLCAVFASRGIQVVKQARNSPEVNACDIGLWNIIKSAVSKAETMSDPDDTYKNVTLIRDLTWKRIQKAWNEEVTAEKLWIIFKKRELHLKKIEELEGDSMGKEPHAGLRKALHSAP